MYGFSGEVALRGGSSWGGGSSQPPKGEEPASDVEDDRNSAPPPEDEKIDMAPSPHDKQKPIAIIVVIGEQATAQVLELRIQF